MCMRHCRIGRIVRDVDALAEASPEPHLVEGVSAGGKITAESWTHS